MRIEVENNPLESILDEPQISLSELVDLMSVAPGKNAAIRASHGGVSSIY